MGVTKLLVANRGEIAVRVIRAAADLGITTVAIEATDDTGSLAGRMADAVVPLGRNGVAAYLDRDRLVAAALETGCDAIHPGYGFLSEDAGFAAAVESAGLTFVGPTPAAMAALGDKSAARRAALAAGVPVLAATDGPTSLEAAGAFLAEHGPVVLKAIAGGGGRGMRLVRTPDELAEAWERARSEALAAFGNGDVYAERLVERARHVEVQVLGDSTGAVIHLGTRDCTLQRRHQKLVELAPAPLLDDAVRDGLHDAAIRLATSVGYRGAGTVEFLVDTAAGTFAFIEANARLQVEHTVTEEISGVDLVQAQLRIAGGATLAELGLRSSPALRGSSIQLRINREVLAADGTVKPAGGIISALDVPGGPGVRVDTGASVGDRPSPAFDSLLAKLVVTVSSGRLDDVLAKAARTLRELRVEGVATNAGVLRALLARPEVTSWTATTRFVDAHVAELVAAAPAPVTGPAAPGTGGAGRPGLAGARVRSDDPLAVLDHGKTDVAPVAAAPVVADHDEAAVVRAPIQGTIVSVDVTEGDLVPIGAQIAVMEAMKMEHVVTATSSGRVLQVTVGAGDTVWEDHVLVVLEPAEVTGAGGSGEQSVDLDHIRPDLAEVIERHEIGLDDRRPDAVARRRKTNQRTTRENVDDLVDDGSFVEYGALALAAQRRRRPLQELIEKTPADGMVTGIGTVEGHPTVVLSYDYTVLAGTQGQQNHRKKDRLFELAERQRLPVVLFTEGGGGRPGDTDATGVAGLDCLAFQWFAQLSGLVPLVGINSGRCFAGNAALLGCCDVVIATPNSNIGMGGPAMIEGGGLGVFRPEEVGPMGVQVPNGVVDVVAADEAEAVAIAKQYLSYFHGPDPEWSCADQRLLRHVIPENRLRTYDVRQVIATMFDEGSVLELRRHFGVGMVTALAKIEGRPVGVVSNNPNHLAGAIDSDGADKAARFLQLCDAFDLPVVFLCDTPGMMVGPEVEKTALVRHCSRLFVTGANLTVPFMTIVLRKGYGLGAQAMAGGSFRAPLFTVGWPTSEFGGMGLEGAVKLGYRNELAAIEDPVERKREFDDRVARMYEHGKGISMASYLEIDDVIDPADSRRWILSAVASAPPPAPRTGKKRPNIDTW
jgi:acetyl/propionyl-CoA carboxylase alpha subunit/acetyl-CoA carboxylase carboxyltransferase component